MTRQLLTPTALERVRQAIADDDLARLKAEAFDRLLERHPEASSGLYHSTLVRVGGRHLRDGRNCQDYALSRSCSQGTVIAVSDGASNYRDEFGCRTPSFNEAGAILITELAVATAIEGLQASLAPDAIRDLVAVQLHSCLRNLWDVLGRFAGQRTLGATLLLGIVTDDCTRLYVSGDGSWGIHVPAGSDMSSLVGDSLILSERPGLTCVRGTAHTPELSGLASLAARHGSDAVVRALPLALGIDVPVAGAWLATDGLVDEPEAAGLLHSTPTRLKSVVDAALRRAESSDDLAIAWASEPFPTSSEVYDV